MEELKQEDAVQLPPERKKKLSEMTLRECGSAGEKLKWILNYVFIDGMSGMALGLFATLIAGTILWQIGSLIDKAGNNPFGLALEAVGKVAQIAMGAGIGVGVCLKLKKTQPLVVASAVAAGMIGSYAQALIKGIQASMESGAAFSISLASAGDPMGAFVGAFAAMTLAVLVSGRTRIDILVTPLVGLAGGALFGIGVGYPVSLALTELGNFIAWAASLSTVAAAVTGLIVSVVMGVALTLPISSAAIGISIGLSGVAAGAAVVGCCCQMMGFAAMSFRENRWGGFVAQGLGTSMLQIPNVFKKPVLFVPPMHAGPGPVCNAHGQRHGHGGARGAHRYALRDDRRPGLQCGADHPVGGALLLRPARPSDARDRRTLPQVQDHQVRRPDVEAVKKFTNFFCCAKQIP